MEVHSSEVQPGERGSQQMTFTTRVTEVGGQAEERDTARVEMGVFPGRSE